MRTVKRVRVRVVLAALLVACCARCLGSSDGGESAQDAGPDGADGADRGGGGDGDAPGGDGDGDGDSPVGDGDGDATGGDGDGDATGGDGDGDGDGQPTGAVVAVEAGGSHSCALIDDGTVQCWGDNGEGEGGTGTAEDNNFAPTAVKLVTGATAITAGFNFNCALLGDGTVMCWGNDQSGQVGDGPGRTNYVRTPRVAAPQKVIAIDAGNNFGCALIEGGTVQCWGANAYGQLGDATAGTVRDLPVDVSGLTGVVGIAAGGAHTCALLDAGTVKCWGADDSGQLGDGADGADPKHAPVDVTGLAAVSHIAAGGSHTCAIVASGKTYCWGRSANGQLGTGPDGLADIESPVEVPALSGLVAMSAGYLHSCGLFDGTDMKCWGRNDEGQTGVGSKSRLHVFTPEAVVGFDGN